MASPRVIALDLGGTKLLSGVVDDEGVVQKRVVGATDTRARTPFWHRSRRPSRASWRKTRRDRDRHPLDDRPAPRGGRSTPSTFRSRTAAPRPARASGSACPSRSRTTRMRRRSRSRRRGAGRGSRHMVMLTLGTGIGGGLVLDGRLYRGASAPRPSSATSRLDLHGPPCQGRCPGRGHLEALASGTAADG